MPTQAEHKAQAERNERFYLTVPNDYDDWGITARFYAALHWMTAYLRTRYAEGEVDRHKKVFDRLVPGGVPGDVRRAYRDLFNYSLESRYQCESDQYLASLIGPADQALKVVRDWARDKV